MTYERFKELWKVLVEDRPRPLIKEDDKNFNLLMSEKLEKALIKYGQGDKSDFKNKL